MEIEIDLFYKIRWGADIGFVILIFYTQLYSYPKLHKLCKEGNHKTWHHRYTRTINYFTVPLFFGDFFSTLYIADITSVYPYLLLMVTFLTFGYFVPLHLKISKNKDVIVNSKYLLHYNWTRVLLWLCMLFSNY